VGGETVPVEGFDAAMATLVRSVTPGMKHAAPILMKQAQAASSTTAASPAVASGTRTR